MFPITVCTCRLNIKQLLTLNANYNAQTKVVDEIRANIKYFRQAGQLPVAMATTGRWHAGIHWEWSMLINVKSIMTAMVTASHNNYLTFIMMIICLFSSYSSSYFYALFFVFLQFNLVYLTVSFLSEINAMWLYFCSTLMTTKMAKSVIRRVGVDTGGCG